MTVPRLTTHAVQRARQRSGHVPHMDRVVPVGVSTVRRMKGWRPVDAAYKQRGLRYFVSASLLILVRGRKAVTVLRLPVGDLAEVLVRLMFRNGGGVPC